MTHNVVNFFEILQFKHVLSLKILFQHGRYQNKNLPDVKLCHTLSTIQTKNLHDAKLCHDPSDWLLKTISFESLYRELSPAYHKHMRNKHKMHPVS